MRRTFVIAAACVAGLAAAPAMAQQTASAQLVGPDGAEMGSVELIQGPKGVVITVDASGLEPGAHGFHIHQTGECQGPDFESAGEHYAPEDSGHGYLADDGYHAGDLPNLHAGTDGIARADYFTDRVSLAEGEPGTLFDEDGSAVIVHERMDSYGDEAGSGGRVACGVISPGQ